MIAKILIPESEKSETKAGAFIKIEKNSVNSIDALCNGAREGIMLVFNVLAMLIAFIATISLANFALSSICQPIFGGSFTIQQIVAYTQVPFASFS